MMKKQTFGFGLIIVGSEILDGRVEDRHLQNARRLLAERNLFLRYAVILPDEPVILEEQLRRALARENPFFCCGGIGATPDDHTRRCAAAAAGVPLKYHEEAAAILKKRFGPLATPHRLKMVEFPAGALIIPNPYNQVPGFSVGDGYFLPGFPEMAEPMMAWVLDTCYEPGAERIARSLLLPGAREADLAGIMEGFIAAHPGLSFSSLPRIAGDGWDVMLGVAGPPSAVEEGMRALKSSLSEAGQVFIDEGK
ncbi:MAG: molybdopterin-binding protein [PVC group bacterium]